LDLPLRSMGGACCCDSRFCRLHSSSWEDCMQGHASHGLILISERVVSPLALVCHFQKHSLQPPSSVSRWITTLRMRPCAIFFFFWPCRAMPRQQHHCRRRPSLRRSTCFYRSRSKCSEVRALQRACILLQAEVLHLVSDELIVDAT
jgi:hypothetical protein